MSTKRKRLDIDKIFNKNTLQYRDSIIVGIGINILIITFILLISKNLPPQVPLFYGLSEGENQLATKFMLIIPPFVSLMILALNLSLTKIVEDEFLTKVLIVAGLATAIFSSITVLRIIFLVGSF